MSVAAAAADHGAFLAVGDERRPRLGRAVVASLLTAAVFTAFAFGAKEVRLLSSHSPWADDPYDAVVSFAIFFVPLVAGLCLVRLPLCRRDEPLPVERAEGLVRGARLILGTVAVTLLSDWIAVVTGANPGIWSDLTIVLVAALAIVSAVTAWAAVELRRVAKSRLGLPVMLLPGPDWLADLVTVAALSATRLGPARRLTGALVNEADRRLVGPIRAHPLAAAGVAALVFGIALALAAAREEGLSPVLWLFVGVGAAGMFAFLAAGGSYLRLVTRKRPLTGPRRRLEDATVLAAASVPLALAFRDGLWRVAGTAPERAGIVELETLLLIAAVATFAAVLLTESATGLHSR